MNSNTAKTKLLTVPADFLKHYPVKCQGTAAVANAVTTKLYNINKQGIDNTLGVGQKRGHMGATRPGILGYQRDISSFRLQPAVSPGSAAIAATHVVPMVNYNTDKFGCPNLNAVVTAMPHYILDGTGDGLMVTGELSNCCFCWVTQGADLWCTHVQPIGIDAIAMQNTLHLTGRFAAAPLTPLRTFGRHNYPTGRASVIGVRLAGTWHLYAQTSADSLKTLTAAFKIYPGGAVAL